MGMSNTATPTYYGQFREAVLRGNSPVNREIALEMNRIDALIANPNISGTNYAMLSCILQTQGQEAGWQ